MKKLDYDMTVKATMENMDTVLSFLEQAVNDAGCPIKTAMQIAVAVEEIYVNVANYAYGNEEGDCKVHLSLMQEEEFGQVQIQIRDSGKPFNPLMREDPDITLSADEREIGGLGIFMAKKIMDHIEYAYNDGENVLSMEKAWDM